MQKKIQVSLSCKKCSARTIYISGYFDPNDPQSFKALDDQVQADDSLLAPCACGIQHIYQEMHIDGELKESLPYENAFEKYDEEGRRPQSEVMDNLFGPFGFG